MTPALTPPVDGLHQLSNETRVIATPWSRMVRGIGLGQHPVGWNPTAAQRIRHVFALLGARGVDDPYSRFSHRLATLVLTVADPGRPVTTAGIREALRPVLDALHAEPNPYFRVMAGCVLMDAFAKLGLGAGPLTRPGADLPAATLATLDAIEPDRIRDENAGRHGHYERLSASTAVILAHGQLGLADRLVTPERDHLREALDLLESVPSPYFRGRGGSMLLCAVRLVDRGDHLTAGGRDRIAEVLAYLDRAASIGNPPAFPKPMSEAFVAAYPLLTMLNAVALGDRPGHHLTHGGDRLAQAAGLMARLTPVERTHMGLYHIIALHNLGRLDGGRARLDAVVEDIVGQWPHIDPGENYFLHGIAYSYLLQTAMLTGRTDLIAPKMLDRLTDGFRDLDATDDDRVNRPYPFAYALNVMAELGVEHLLFEPRAAYDGASPIAWVTGRLSDGGHEEPRLYMLHHALVSWALRLRPAGRPDTPLYAGLRLPAAG